MNVQLSIKKYLGDIFKQLFVNLEPVVMNNPENVLSGSEGFPA